MVAAGGSCCSSSFPRGIAVRLPLLNGRFDAMSCRAPQRQAAASGEAAKCSPTPPRRKAKQGVERRLLPSPVRSTLHPLLRLELRCSSVHGRLRAVLRLCLAGVFLLTRRTHATQQPRQPRQPHQLQLASPSSARRSRAVPLEACIELRGRTQSKAARGVGHGHRLPSAAIGHPLRRHAIARYHIASLLHHQGTLPRILPGAPRQTSTHAFQRGEATLSS